MPNMDSAIKSHNSQLLKNDTEGKEKRSCNCRKKETCPVEGKCLEEGIIYEATIKSNSEKKYVGLTEGSFKKRLYGHRQSFRNNNLRTATELGKHIWDLKDRKKSSRYHGRSLKGHTHTMEHPIDAGYASWKNSTS